MTTKLTTAEGKEGIKATVLADSEQKDHTNLRISTLELEYPRFIHSELMTHRLFSKNAASSRAIPIMKKIKMVWSNPAMPVHWGKNQSGMQAKEELTGFMKSLARFTWRAASKVACVFAYAMHKIGVHKQIANRMLEPWERMKVVLTSTEFENWFWLRDHEDAQPEIRELALCMYEALMISKPQALNPGEWHLPYITTTRTKDGELIYLSNDVVVDLETAKRISVSSCAQVSYRVLNQSIDKAEDIYKKLIDSVPVHASPCEHQAKPMVNPYPAKEEEYFEIGATHYNFEFGSIWSGNFQGWIQNRQLIPNNVKMR